MAALRNDKSNKSYVRKLRSRARELYNSDAFATAEDEQRKQAIAEVGERYRAEKRKGRKRIVVFALICLVFVLVSLPIPYSPDYFNQLKVYSPAEVLDAYRLFYIINIAPVLDPTQANLAQQWQQAFIEYYDASSYYEITMRFGLTMLTVACAWLLAVSGMLFQTTFRNPLAVPSMLGVSDGVTIGYILFMTLGYTSMPDNPSLFFLCTYGCGVAVALVVLFASRFVAGAKTYNVMDMLLIGTVIAQIAGGIVTFIVNYGMDDATLMVYYDLLQSIDAATEPLTYAIVLVVLLLTGLPIVLMRFRMNALSASDAEAKMLGVRIGAQRWLALACGGLMQLAAITSIGQVAMVSLAVPFLARYLFPSEFRHQLMGNLLISVPLLLICQILCHFIVVNYQPLNVGTLISLVIMPVFVWMMALQKKGWS